jgi:hypothetical protein
MRLPATFANFVVERNGQPRPEQRTVTLAPAGSALARSERSVKRLARTVQFAVTRAGLRSPSSCRPHGGLALTMRPGRQVATKLAKLVTGLCARTV